MNEGLTGWLSATGEFFPCEYGEHYELASFLIEEHLKKEEILEKRKEVYELKKQVVTSERALLELMQWIPMGIPKWGSQPNKDYVFIHYEVGMTEKQKKWFRENEQNLSATQIKMLREAMEDFGISFD